MATPKTLGAHSGGAPGSWVEGLAHLAPGGEDFQNLRPTGSHTHILGRGFHSLSRILKPASSQRSGKCYTP